MEIIITLLSLSLVIFVHELGHYFAARWCGVGVLEFSVGMGPVVFSKRHRDTSYSLRLLPIGGFVKLAGLDNEDSVVPDDQNYRKKSVLQRFFILFSGSGMNLVLGYILFFFIVLSVGTYDVSRTIQAVMDGSPAAELGLQKGDEIVSINQRDVIDVPRDLIQTINQSKGQVVQISYLRSGQEYDLQILPRLDESRQLYQIGIQLGSIHQDVSFLSAFGEGGRRFLGHIALVFKSLHMLVTGQALLKDMTGPIGIVQIASFSLSKSWLGFFEIMGLITVSLGIINLFPFPVLDGGHLTLLLIEGVRGKPLHRRIEDAVNAVGVFCLILLMILIVFNDIRFWPDRVDFLKQF